MSLKGLSQERKQKIGFKMLTFRADAEVGGRGTWDRMTIAELMKIGQQWDYDDKSWNQAHGKFSLTINEILPIVLDISGTQTSNPNDINVRNVKGGTRKIAEILSALSKNVMDKSDGEAQKSMAFEDGITTGRGFLGLSISYEHDPDNGDFELRKLDPFLVAPDPACTAYDYNDHENGAKFIIVDDWIDKDKMKLENPGVAAQLDGASFNFEHQGRFRGLMGFMFRGFQPFQLKDDYRNHKLLEEPQQFSKEKNNFRRSTYWWREYKKGAYIQRLDDKLNVLALHDPKDITLAKVAAKKNNRLRVIEKDRNGNPLTIPVLNMTIMVGDVLVDHKEDPFGGMNSYPIFRYSPYFDNGYEYGVVENLIGPQKTLNFSFSAVVNLMKQLANTGWIVDKGTVKLLNKLKEHGSQDGIVLKREDYGNITKIEHSDFPVGFDVIAERSKQNMRETSQVRLSEPRTGRPESGKAKEVDEAQALKVQGVPFRNWGWTEVIMAKTLIELIRITSVFDEDEVRAIVEEKDLVDPETLDKARQIVVQQFEQSGVSLPDPPLPPDQAILAQAQPVVQQTMIDNFQTEQQIFQQIQQQIDQFAIPIAQDMLFEDIRGMKKGRYGIKVDTSPASPTQRFLRQLQTFKLNETLLAGGQPGVSRRQLVESTDVANKEEIISDVPQVAGAA